MSLRSVHVRLSNTAGSSSLIASLHDLGCIEAFFSIQHYLRRKRLSFSFIGVWDTFSDMLPLPLFLSKARSWRLTSEMGAFAGVL